MKAFKPYSTRLEEPFFVRHVLLIMVFFSDLDNLRSDLAHFTADHVGRD